MRNKIDLEMRKAIELVPQISTIDLKMRKAIGLMPQVSTSDIEDIMRRLTGEEKTS